ncbi:MAG TPA: peptidylprolyl isomerase [Actinomycetales bacterium]
MPTSRDRERERARRRLVKRQASQTERTGRRRRNQQIIGAVVTVLVVVLGVAALSRMVDPETPAAAGPCPAAPSAPSDVATFASAPPRTLAEGKVWDASVVTSCGTIGFELYGDKAPQTVSSFIYLAREGFYDDSPCHRLTTSESLKVLQCGDPTGQGTGGPGYTYGVENVPADGAYPAGTLAMARAESPDSNGSQFFITHGDSTLPTDGGGYSVFGKVTQGLDVLATIAAGGTTNGSPDGPPTRSVSIESITVTPR